MNKIMIAAVVVVILGIGGFYFSQSGNGGEDAMMEKEESSQMEKTGEVMEKAEGYSGNLIAGSSSPFIEFSQEDYEKALAENKVVFLDFYANWCPICRAEAPELKAGFDGLTSSKVVGFRVNYNDSDTDENEKALAEQFGIGYQHTKVILVGGKEVLKDGSSWDNEMFNEEIGKVI